MPGDLAAWLRGEIGWWLDYGQKNRARRPITPMRSHEMQLMVARCEAELAILDLYEEQSAKAGENAMEEDRTWTLGRAVRLLGSGYRSRPGYREEWKP